MEPLGTVTQVGFQSNIVTRQLSSWLSLQLSSADDLLIDIASISFTF